MPQTVYCAGCKRNYRVNAGPVEKVVRCPQGHPLTVPAASAPPTEPQVVVRKLDPEQAPRSSAGKALVLVCFGLFGLLLVLGVGGVVAVVLITTPVNGPTGTGYAAADTKSEARPPTNPGPGTDPRPIPTQPEKRESSREGGNPVPPPSTGPKPVTASVPDPKPPEPPPALAGGLRSLDRLDRTKLDNFVPEEVKSRVDPPPPTVLDGHTNHVRCVAFTDDGQFVVSVSGDLWREEGRKPDNSIRVWDARTGKQLHALKGFKEALDSLCVSPGGRYASFTYSGYWDGDKYIRSKDNNIHLLDIQTKKVLERKFEGLESSVFSTAISPDRRRVAAGDAASNLRLWDTATRGTVAKGEVRILRGFVRGVAATKFSPDGTRLIVVVADHTARVHDVETGRQLGGPLVSHQDIIWSLDVHQSKGGALLAITGGGSRQKEDDTGFEDGAKDYAIRLWNLDDRQKPRQFEGHTSDVTALAFCPDGRHFVSGAKDEKVLLWDVSTDRPVRTLGEHKGAVWSVAVSPDGRTCVSGGTDDKVRFWHLPTAHDLTDALAKSTAADFKRVVEKDMDVIGVDALTIFPKLVQTLSHSDAGFRDTARQVITQLASRTEKGDLPFEKCALPDVLKVLEGNNPVAWKVLAIRDVRSFGDDAKKAVPVLVKMDPENPELAAAIAETLGKLGERSPEVFNRLHGWLEHKESGVRLNALVALKALGPDALKLDLVLERAQKETSRQVQAMLLQTCQEMVRGAKPDDLPTLRKGLASNQSAICLSCTEVIGSFGAGGGAAVPDLLALLPRTEVEVRLAALRALGAVGTKDKSAIAELVKLVDPKVEPQVGTQATITLAKLDPLNRVVIEQGMPMLIERLGDANENVRRLAQEGLAQIGPKAVSPLTLKLIGGNDTQRRVAAEALATLGPRAERAIPDLTEALADTKAPVRAAASEALGKIGAKALPVLVKQLTHPNENVRKAAADGLGVMGPAAAAAIPALKKVENSNDKRTVTGAAKRALDRIDPSRK